MDIVKRMIINRINFLRDILGMEVVGYHQHSHMVTSAPLVPHSDCQLMAGESQVGSLCLTACAWIFLVHTALDRY